LTEEEAKLPIAKAGNTRTKHLLWVDFRRVKLDGRTALAKAINLMRSELTKHVGGAPSITQSLLIERITHKAIKAHIYETNYLRSIEQGSKDHYLALVNSLRLDLQCLGLKPKAAKVLDLSEYLKKTEDHH
jgi:hypothetical protein